MNESRAGKLALVEEMRKFGKDKLRNCLRIILADEMRKFGKDKFRNCLRIIRDERMRKYGKDKFGNCLVIISMMRILIWNHDQSEEGERFAWGNLVVDCKKRMNRMTVQGVFIPSYGAIE